MLVTPRRRPVTLVVLALLAGTAPLAAADRPGAWTQAALDAATLTREDADRAFAAGPADAAADGATARVDESALRYYASQHATSRVEAEIRRLRALYPGWEPPADLYKPGAGAADEQALWELYGKNRIDDLKLEIERRAARQPGWRPSQDMVDKLRRKELRLELVAASDKSDWQGVLKIADREPLLIAAGDLDVLWRVAEASSRTGTDDRALELYRLAMSSAGTPAERLGTARKAVAVLGTDKAATLLTDERIGPDGKGEFEPMRLDLARARIGEWLRPDSAKPTPDADIARIAALAKAADAAPGDAALLGWVEHRRKNPKAAIEWFDAAIAKAGDGKAVEGKAALGAVVAREAAGRHAEALDFAAARVDDPEVGALFLDLLATDLTRPKPPQVGADRLARFAALTEKLESGDAAQALAWYAYGARQFEPARAWFTKAMAWRPSAKSAEGHLLALIALGDKAGAARLEIDYRGRFPDLPQMRRPEPPTRTAHAAAAGATPAPAPKRSCPAQIAEWTLRRAAAPADALASGWCLMEMKRAEEAAVAFETARHGDARIAAEASYGQALAALRSGRTDDAARVAASGNLTPARREEIGRVVLAQQAIAHFDRSDYASAVATLDRRRAHAEEPRDLMTMRAWALYHLGRRSEAFDLFTLLDAQFSTRESRAGLAATGPVLRRS